MKWQSCIVNPGLSCSELSQSIKVGVGLEDWARKTARMQRKHLSTNRQTLSVKGTCEWVDAAPLVWGLVVNAACLEWDTSFWPTALHPRLWVEFHQLSRACHLPHRRVTLGHLYSAFISYHFIQPVADLIVAYYWVYSSYFLFSVFW